jgi:hypothetical protein
MRFVEKEQYNFVAIKTGAISDVFVLDIDTRDKPDDDLLAGLPLWNRLVIAKHGEPDTLKATTASFGFHYYFAYGSFLKDGLQTGKFFDGVDYEGHFTG